MATNQVQRSPAEDVLNDIRDSIATLPEGVDISVELSPDLARRASEDRLNEALLETFPASDALASGRFA